MNDEELERRWRDIPSPALPEAWRGEILAVARREAGRARRTRPGWSPVLAYVGAIFRRNPLTAGALATLWLLIFVLRSTTPIDPAEKEMLAIKIDPKRPIYFVSLAREMALAQSWQEMDDDPPKAGRLLMP